MNRRSFIKGMVTLLGATLIVPKILLAEDKITDPLLIPEVIDIGYKGSTYVDSGIFYCPHIPLQITNCERSNKIYH